MDYAEPAAEAGAELAFSAADLGAALDALPAEALDALPYGVIRMDRAGIVTAYNALESRMAGLSPERVLGRPFFSQVAPCCDNGMVAGRYFAVEVLDHTLEYVFTLRMRVTPVRLRLLKPGGPHMYLLVLRH